MENRKRMLKLGGWLERYLNPDVKPEEYKTLEQDFIKVYDLDLKFSHNDIMFEIIRRILELCGAQKGDNAYIWLCDDPLNLQRVVEDISRTMLQNEEDLQLQNEEDRKDFVPIVISVLHQNIMNVFRFRSYISDVFREIKGSEETWQLTLGKKQLEQERAVIKNYNFEQPITLLCHEYGKFHTALIIDRASTELKLTQELVNDSTPQEFPDRAPPGKESTIIKEWNIPTTGFQWGAAIARVFFDFLMAGGQSYIVFCKHCGRFSVASRLKKDGSPEKLFCSDRCRTANKLK